MLYLETLVGLLDALRLDVVILREFIQGLRRTYCTIEPLGQKYERVELQRQAAAPQTAHTRNFMWICHARSTWRLASVGAADMLQNVMPRLGSIGSIVAYVRCCNGSHFLRVRLPFAVVPTSLERKEEQLRPLDAVVSYALPAGWRFRPDMTQSQLDVYLKLLWQHEIFLSSQKPSACSTPPAFSCCVAAPHFAPKAPWQACYHRPHQLLPPPRHQFPQAPAGATCPPLPFRKIR